MVGFPTDRVNQGTPVRTSQVTGRLLIRLPCRRGKDSVHPSSIVGTDWLATGCRVVSRLIVGGVTTTRTTSKVSSRVHVGHTVRLNRGPLDSPQADVRRTHPLTPTITKGVRESSTRFTLYAYGDECSRTPPRTYTQHTDAHVYKQHTVNVHVRTSTSSLYKSRTDETNVTLKTLISPVSGTGVPQV